jgi:hypothetical protein
VELLILDVDFAHFGLHMLAGLGLEQHVCFPFFDSITLHRNACVSNVGRKLEGWFLDTVLSLQVDTSGVTVFALH